MNAQDKMFWTAVGTSAIAGLGVIVAGIALILNASDSSVEQLDKSLVSSEAALHEYRNSLLEILKASDSSVEEMAKSLASSEAALHEYRESLLEILKTDQVSAREAVAVVKAWIPSNCTSTPNPAIADVPTVPYLLFIDNPDQPGSIGAVGTVAGRNNINISFMEVGRLSPRGRAMMVIGLDDPVPPEVLAEINALPQIHDARLVKL